MRNPTQQIGLSEYGAGSAITHHTDNVYRWPCLLARRQRNAADLLPAEGYADYVHEKSYAQIVNRPYLMGSWIWNMFDFGSAGGTRATSARPHQGFSYFRPRHQKDVFYFYKANWTTTPVTYIAAADTSSALTRSPTSKCTATRARYIESQRPNPRHQDRSRVPACTSASSRTFGCRQKQQRFGDRQPCRTTMRTR